VCRVKTSAPTTKKDMKEGTVIGTEETRGKCNNEVTWI
jgi:hypothetical protein